MVLNLITEGGSELIPCDHIQTRRLTEGFPEKLNGPWVGTAIVLSPSGREIQLPRDAKEAWVMNDAGRTVAHYMWPPRKDRVDNQS